MGVLGLIPHNSDTIPNRRIWSIVSFCNSARMRHSQAAGGGGEGGGGGGGGGDGWNENGSVRSSFAGAGSAKGEGEGPQDVPCVFRPMMEARGSFDMKREG